PVLFVYTLSLTDSTWRPCCLGCLLMFAVCCVLTVTAWRMRSLLTTRPRAYLQGNMRSTPSFFSYTGTSTPDIYTLSLHDALPISQRIMDCGDAGHILVSKRVADDLAQSRRWQPYLHDLGDVEVKHGMSVSVVNFYADVVGNP